MDLQVGAQALQGLVGGDRTWDFILKQRGSHWRVLSRGDIIGLTQSKHLPIQDHPLLLSLSNAENFFAGVDQNRKGKLC